MGSWISLILLVIAIGLLVIGFTVIPDLKIVFIILFVVLSILAIVIGIIIGDKKKKKDGE